MSRLIRQDLLRLAGLTLFVGLLLSGCRDFAELEPCELLSCGEHGRCAVGADGWADCECDAGFEAIGLWCRPEGTTLEAIYVDPTFEVEERDGSESAPFATLEEAISAAKTQSVGQVIIGGSPTFSEPLELADGVSIIGGYQGAPGWEPDAAQRPAWLVSQGEAGQDVVAMTAVDIIAETILRNLRVEALGPEASADGVGASCYGIRADRAPGLRLDNVIVVAGAGGAGSAGEPGVEGDSGNPGGDSAEEVVDDSPCSGTTDAASAGGSGGVTTCVGDNNDGGRGGDSAAPDRTNPGVAGGDAERGGAGGGVGLDGSDGQSFDDPADDGRGGLAEGEVDDGFWLAGASATGAAGSDGLNGGGGGGGGSGTPVSLAASCSSGTGGGGGGSGGCGGRGGVGGHPGGASIAFFVVSSPGLVVRDSSFTASNGGGGGAGGAGGAGGVGGNGGVGTPCTSSDGISGGDGGDGGDGQTGGVGGGGAGGPSFGGYCDASLTIEGESSFVHASPGLGGGTGDARGADGEAADAVECE